MQEGYKVRIKVPNEKFLQRKLSELCPGVDPTGIWHGPGVYESQLVDGILKFWHIHFPIRSVRVLAGPGFAGVVPERVYDVPVALDSNVYHIIKPIGGGEWPRNYHELYHASMQNSLEGE